jgi:hypothetical protein
VFASFWTPSQRVIASRPMRCVNFRTDRSSAISHLLGRTMGRLISSIGMAPTPQFSIAVRIRGRPIDQQGRCRGFDTIILPAAGTRGFARQSTTIGIVGCATNILGAVTFHTADDVQSQPRLAAVVVLALVADDVRVLGLSLRWFLA